jgi:glycosyltransferase involved in cell wall biosynthesis
MTGVSYVFTVYNKVPFLPRVVAGLARQAGDFAREYIFVDDGSTDDSAGLLEELTKTMVTPTTKVVIHRQANAGPATALNKGLALATHDYVKLMDADDILVPEATTALLQALSYQHAVLVIGRDGLYDPSDAAELPTDIGVRRSGEITVVDHPLNKVVKRAYFNPSCILGRREDFLRAGGSDERVFIQDYSLALRLARLGKFVELDKTIYLSPQIAADRLSDNGAQILHDLNLSLGLFLQDQPGLSPQFIKAAAYRATSRAWKWARREQGASLFSQYHRLLISSLFAPPSKGAALCLTSCGSFQESGRVRRLQQ